VIQVPHSTSDVPLLENAERRPISSRMKKSTASQAESYVPVPELPRTEWLAHPNFPTNSGLLRAHDSFRDISAYLVEKSREASTIEIAQLMFLFLRWKGAMKNHEAYEEGRLYPYLAARHGVSFDILEQQHERLGELEQKVVRAWGSGDSQGVADGLIEHDQVLVHHLVEEEDMVIPMVLALPPEIYARDA